MQSPKSRQSAVLPPHLARQREGVSYPMEGSDFEGGELILPGDAVSAAGEDLEERVQSTQNRLAQLRAEAENLEREKQQFEELSRQQKEFMQGRADMGEKFTRALSHLDREIYEAQKRVEQLMVIKDTFNHHLDVIDSLNPEQWNPHDLRQDLSRALGMIEDARDEYISSSARIQQLTSVGLPAAAASAAPASVSAPMHAAPMESRYESRASAAAPMAAFGPDTFKHWLFCGLAFTTPVIAVAFVGFVIWLLVR